MSVFVDTSVGVEGDFPSLYRHAPVFSQRAWNSLKPLVENAVEALPLIYANDQVYFVLNVVDLVNGLDHATSTIERYSDGRIAEVLHYIFHPDAVRDKHFFKFPESAGLEVLVSSEFVQAVDDHGLKGAVFQK